jgi:hypothetical protein
MSYIGRRSCWPYSIGFGEMQAFLLSERGLRCLRPVTGIQLRRTALGHDERNARRGLTSYMVAVRDQALYR